MARYASWETISMPTLVDALWLSIAQAADLTPTSVQYNTGRCRQPHTFSPITALSLSTTVLQDKLLKPEVASEPRKRATERSASNYLGIRSTMCCSVGAVPGDHAVITCALPSKSRLRASCYAPPCLRLSREASTSDQPLLLSSRPKVSSARPSAVV